MNGMDEKNPKVQNIFKEKEHYTYEDFLEIIARLRGKDGCPWDRQQTHESLRTCMLEEAYEAVDAINEKDDENLKEELGDVMLQVVMHAQIASEEGRFDMSDIIDDVAKKMIRRHPHIFGSPKAVEAGAVPARWEDIKKQEKHETSVYEGICRVPKALPANMRAQKILKKAAAAGFAPLDVSGLEKRVENDFESLKKAADFGNVQQTEQRLGVLLFDLMNLSRFLGVNAENSLTNVIEKFINRLGSVENRVNTDDSGISELPPELFGALWDLQ